MESMNHDCTTEYDKIVDDFIKQTEVVKKKVFVALALFTLEWKYSFDFTIR